MPGRPGKGPRRWDGPRHPSRPPAPLPEPPPQGLEAPPDPPHELDADPVETRSFEGADGKRWGARVAGKSVNGTGGYGLAMVEAVHFYDPDAPQRPIAEALLARGRFMNLYDEELRTLHARATPIAEPPARG